MDEQQFVEEYSDDEAIDEETKEGMSLGGKILGGLLTATVVGGGAAVYKNRGRIKAWATEVSNKRKAKKLQKLLGKAAKLGYKGEGVPEAETKE